MLEKRFTFYISRLQQEASAALLAATQTPKHMHIHEDENGEDDEMTNGDNGSGGGDVSRDLDTDENIKDPVEDRRTLAERNERLHDQLKVSDLILSENIGMQLMIPLFNPVLGFEARFGSITWRYKGDSKR